MRFVLVNGRTPREKSFCPMCCEPIGESYLREIATRLSYCNRECYLGRGKKQRPGTPISCKGVMTVSVVGH